MIARRPTSYDVHRISQVNWRKTGVAATTCYLLVDLDNEGGEYKHAAGSEIHTGSIICCGVKSNVSDKWFLQIGAVLAIDADEATIGWVRLGGISMRDTSIGRCESLNLSPIMSCCFGVADGDYTHIATNCKELVSSINTGAGKVEDIGGVQRNAAVGDLILRATLESGSGTLTFQYMLWYEVA